MSLAIKRVRNLPPHLNNNNNNAICIAQIRRKQQMVMFLHYLTLHVLKFSSPPGRLTILLVVLPYQTLWQYLVGGLA